MDRREKIVTLAIAAAIPAVGIPVGVALGLSDSVILASLFAICAVVAIAPTMWGMDRRNRDRR